MSEVSISNGCVPRRDKHEEILDSICKLDDAIHGLSMLVNRIKGTEMPPQVEVTKDPHVSLEEFLDTTGKVIDRKAESIRELTAELTAILFTKVTDMPIQDIPRGTATLGGMAAFRYNQQCFYPNLQTSILV